MNTTRAVEEFLLSPDRPPHTDHRRFPFRTRNANATGQIYIRIKQVVVHDTQSNASDCTILQHQRRYTHTHYFYFSIFAECSEMCARAYFDECGRFPNTFLDQIEIEYSNRNIITIILEETKTAWTNEINS